MTAPVYFDTHAHLDFPDFAGEIEAIISRAGAAGINRIITIGTTLEGSQRAVEIAERFEQVYAAVGWHPSNVTSAPDKLPNDLTTLAKHPKVVAIGETGVDFSRLPGSPEADADYKKQQAALFTQQIELAIENKLNIIVHQRAAFPECLDILRPYSKQVRAVFHCFVGMKSEQEQVAALGSIVSFTGIVTFKNASEVRETVRATPLGSFMLETDAPYLAPVPHRGKRCEPAFVAATAAFIAELKGCTMDELSRATCDLAREFFPKLK